MKKLLLALFSVVCLAACTQKQPVVSATDWANTVVYEMNVRQYTPEGTFAAAQRELPRLKELGIENRVPIVGLAKRLEEVFYPGDPTPYYLSRTGEPLKVICHLRDEAHRFGITFHRHKRTKSFIDSELSHIPGIGDKSLTALLRHFKTVRAVRKASHEQLTEIVGAKRAEAILTYFGNNREK